MSTWNGEGGGPVFKGHGERLNGKRPRSRSPGLNLRRKRSSDNLIGDRYLEVMVAVNADDHLVALLPEAISGGNMNFLSRFTSGAFNLHDNILFDLHGGPVLDSTTHPCAICICAAISAFVKCGRGVRLRYMSDDQKDRLKQLLSNTNALLEAMRYSVGTVTGEYANIGRYSSYKTFLRKYNNLVTQAAPRLPDTTMLDVFNLDRVKGSGDTTWIQQKEMFDSTYSNAALLKSLLEGAIGYAEDETRNLIDFIQANLRRTIFAIPEKEIEVQNGLEALFVGRNMAKGTDYDRETGRVKTSGKESIPDFIIPRLKLSLEIKLLKSGQGMAIVDEINADIRTYRTQYERQLYIVYDLGMIRDEQEFKLDLEDAPGVSVLIIKH